MSFPISPTNGQTTTVNGVLYTYNSTTTAWNVTTAFTGNIVTTTLSATGTVTGASVVGGNPGPFSTVDRITYATDTATTSVRGPLSVARSGSAAAGNSTDGWFCAGYIFSIVERITYATDTAATSTRGPLSLTRYTLTGAAGIQ